MGCYLDDLEMDDIYVDDSSMDDSDLDDIYVDDSSMDDSDLDDSDLDDLRIDTAIQQAVRDQEEYFEGRDRYLPHPRVIPPPRPLTPPTSQPATVPRPSLRSPTDVHRHKRWRAFRARRRGQGKRAHMKNTRVAKAMRQAIRVPFGLSDLRASYKTKFEAKVYRHEELRGLGIRTVEWDGIGALPIVTRSGRIVALLAGRPKEQTWEARMKTLAEAVDTAKAEMSFPEKLASHRRGDYPTVATGISYGGGAMEPGELGFTSQRNARAIRRLRETPELSHLSGFVNGSLETYALGLSTFCRTILTRLEDANPDIRRPFPNSAFGSLSINFGPDVCTIPHKDYKNLSWGWCAVTSFGSYDHTKGGHLVLWDLGIAVEFPPHSTILLPSAIVEHSNTAIQEGEKRSTITQYNSAGLFRWVAYGFIPKWVAEEFELQPETWWAKPKNKFSKVFED